MLILAVQVQTPSGEELTHLKWASLEIFWTEFRREKDLAPPRGNQPRNPKIITSIYTGEVEINNVDISEESGSFYLWLHHVSRYCSLYLGQSYNDNGGRGRETRGCITITDQAKSVCSVLSHVGRLFLADTCSSAAHTPTPWGTSPVTCPSSPPS